MTEVLETEQCPCLAFDLDVGAPRPGLCFCGDPQSQHDIHGRCLVWHDVNAPYNPELTQAALRLAQRWADNFNS